jgi:hypothetical protein
VGRQCGCLSEFDYFPQPGEESWPHPLPHHGEGSADWTPCLKAFVPLKTRRGSPRPVKTRLNFNKRLRMCRARPGRFRVLPD